jgi:ubiquinone/menaquinone biosynthesis C-methylase UbiE
VIGLGLNQEELDNNNQLTGYRLHDLNKTPRMPFDDKAFDAVICTVSVEYLTQPFEVFEEVSQILKVGIFYRYLF